MKRTRLVGLIVATTASLAAGSGTPGAAQAMRPGVCIWYRGTPVGVPVQDELAFVRALGFGAVVWPFDDAARRRDLERMADLVGLRVLTPADADRSGGQWFQMSAAGESATLLAAQGWLAIARGARVLSVDGGAPAGAGLRDSAGTLAPWVRPVQGLARQVDANAELIGRLRPGPPIAVDAGALRVILLEGGPAWVLVAANPSTTTQSATARMPRTVPYGPWLSLIDGTNMAMIDRPSDREYRVTLPAGSAQVYVIDK